MRTSTIALAMAGALALAGCATGSTVHQSYKAASPETYAVSMTAASTAGEADIPSLRAQVDEKLAAAGLAGRKGDGSARDVSVTITHWYVRHGAARALVGVMAGRDKIVSKVEVKGANGQRVAAFDVESTNATAWGTTGGLLGKHAQEIVDRLKSMQ